MNIVLVALNASYIHTPLGIWCLEKAIKENLNKECIIIDRTVNDDMDLILADIMASSPDIVCFSVYIWNVMQVRRLIYSIKQISNDIKIVLGGPEVSYGIAKEDDLYIYSDHIIKGEGQSALCGYLKDGTIVEDFCVEEKKDQLMPDYDEEIMKRCENRLIYFETSRGCPFSCSYCLSSDNTVVRCFDIDTVKTNLLRIMSNTKGQTIKFVDRTFNCNKKRANQLIEFINLHGNGNSFHLELVPDIIDDETIHLLNKSKKGTYRIEIGLQSTNEKTLMAVNRISNPQKALMNIKKLKEGGMVHIHLDLIAGLPYEDMTSFKKSFNDVYNAGPDELQVGFLKFLKGAPITLQTDEYDFKYSKYPPYEIISSRFLSYSDIVSLKKMETVFNRVYNSKLFITTLDVLYRHFRNDAYDLYDKMTTYLVRAGFFTRRFSFADIAGCIDSFALEYGICVKESIVFDHLSVSRGFSLSDRFKPSVNVRKETEKALITAYGRDIMKRVSFYPFSDGIRVFFHDEKDPVSGYFKSMLI